MSEVKNDASAASRLSSNSDDPAQYWGYLFKRNKAPTEKLDRLLRGIHLCISKKHHVPECHDLTPPQLAAFYRDVGGNYDPLFVDNDSTALAFIYKSLGCLHSLQPDPSEDDNGYASPSLPALKPRGFVTWQTIQLLLGPQEHAAFLQNALKTYEVRDPVTKTPFPKVLPSSCFPAKPDPDMERWHDKVANRLQDEAEDAHAQERSHHHLVAAHRGSRPVSAARDGTPTPGADRIDGVRYTSNPHHRDASSDSRPSFVRTWSKNATPKLKEGGKAVALTVKDIANPFIWNNKPSSSSSKNDHGSRPRRRSRDTRAEEEVVELDHNRGVPSRRTHPHHSTIASASAARAPRESHSSSRHPAPRSRSMHAGSSSSSTESDDVTDRRPTRRKPRRHRSHDPPMSDYFTRRADYDHDSSSRPSSQYLSENGNNTPNISGPRRKSDDHGRKGARDRARFSVSEGSHGRPSPLTPEDAPPRANYAHMNSVGHARPGTGGPSPHPDRGERYTSNSRPPSGSNTFADPFARDAYRRGFDHRAFRSPPAGADVQSAAGSGVSSASGGSGVGGERTHRYVTPSPMNGVRGRAYPAEGWR